MLGLIAILSPLFVFAVPCLFGWWLCKNYIAKPEQQDDEPRYIAVVSFEDLSKENAIIKSDCLISMQSTLRAIDTQNKIFNACVNDRLTLGCKSFDTTSKVIY